MSDNDLTEALLQVWKATLSNLKESAATIEAAVAALVEGRLDAERRLAAQREAHKLAGTLGTFGLTAASSGARRAEEMLGPDVAESDMAELSAIAIAISDAVEVGPSPKRLEAMSSGATSEETRTAGGLSRGYVVALDDDQVILALVGKALEDAGFEVLTTLDSGSLLDHLKKRSPDLLIIDIDMPGMDGLSVCRELRSDPNLSSIPVVFLSARSDADTQREVFVAGADDYLIKPIAQQDLVVRVTNRLARAGSRISSKPTLKDSSVDVLVVDDDETLGTLVLHSLESHGLSTKWVKDGTEARSLLLEGDALPRVVLLDVGLPGQDGLSLLRELKSSGRADMTKVIMVTLRAGEDEVIEALELGAVDHVAKPLSIPVLVRRVQRALETSL